MELDWIPLLRQLRSYRLLPVRGKVPIDPGTGRPTGWDAATFGPDAIARFAAHGLCTGVGMHTGPDAGPGGVCLLAFDVDGEAGCEFLLARGCDPFSGPAAATWGIVRREDRHRLKVVWRVPPDREPRLGTFRRMRSLREKVTGPDGGVLHKGEGIEAYCGVGQIVCLGLHPESGGQYRWRGNPQLLLDLPPAWEALLPEITASSASGAGLNRPARGRGQWLRLQRCPICGRDERPICQQHRDGGTVRCFQGETFHPPAGLRRGEVISGWAFCGEQQVGWGEFAVFVRHQPREGQHGQGAAHVHRRGRRGHQSRLRRF